MKNRHYYYGLRICAILALTVALAASTSAGEIECGIISTNQPRATANGDISTTVTPPSPSAGGEMPNGVTPTLDAEGEMQNPASVVAQVTWDGSTVSSGCDSRYDEKPHHC
jgi:hypothetical protein